MQYRLIRPSKKRRRGLKSKRGFGRADHSAGAGFLGVNHTAGRRRGISEAPIGLCRIVQPGGTSVVFVTAANDEGVTSISAEQLIVARSLLRWAQQDVANRAGGSQATVEQLETGAPYPTIRVASALRDSLGDLGAGRGGIHAPKRQDEKRSSGNASRKVTNLGLARRRPFVAPGRIYTSG